MLTISHSLNRRVLNWSLATAAAVGIIASLPSKTMALTGFTGSYAPSNWTFTNTNAGTNTGSVDTTNATSGTINLTGSDNGSENPDTTDWTTTISGSGNIYFGWNFSTSDTPSGDDSAGYLLNGNFNQLINNFGLNDTSSVSGSAPVTILVNSGDTFGFRVATGNIGGPGVFQVTDFDVTPVPFESSPTVLLTALPVLGLMRFYRQRQRRKIG